MSRDVTTALAVLAVAGQVLIVVFALVGGAAAVGVGGPLRSVRGLLWGYELWAAFLVAAIGTGGSLYFSQILHYVPCELCWYQRICLYPLSIILLLAALAGDFRIARYVLPLPVVGAGISVYHLLVENRVVEQSSACLVSAPGGCATKWIDEFGYITIPTLALTAFLLLVAFLTFAAVGGDGRAILEPDAQR